MEYRGVLATLELVSEELYLARGALDVARQKRANKLLDDVRAAQQRYLRWTREALNPS